MFFSLSMALERSRTQPRKPELEGAEVEEEDFFPPAPPGLCTFFSFQTEMVMASECLSRRS